MSADLSRIVTFTNITSEDFSHLYDGRPYTIRANESMLFPYDLGRHLAKHLARKILFSDVKPEVLRNDRALFTKETENELINKIIGQETRREVPKELSESERLARRVEELNEFKPDGAPEGRTKADVISEMEKKGLEVDKRKSMATLEEELEASKTPNI